MQRRADTPLANIHPIREKQKHKIDFRFAAAVPWYGSESGCICIASLRSATCKQPCTPAWIEAAVSLEFRLAQPPNDLDIGLLMHGHPPKKREEELCMHSIAWWPTAIILVIAAFNDLRSLRIPTWLALPFFCNWNYCLGLNAWLAWDRRDFLGIGPVRWFWVFAG
jgi:hypothetical protein